MGQKHSSSEVADSEIVMTNRTDLSSHFTNVMSKTYQTDECYNCGAALEDNNLFNSSTGTAKKSSAEVSVRCRQCRVCESTNVILEKFRTVISSSPRSIPILPNDSSNQFKSQSINCPRRHHMRTKSSFEITPNNSTANTFTESTSSCV